LVTIKTNNLIKAAQAAFLLHFSPSVAETKIFIFFALETPLIAPISSSTRPEAMQSGSTPKNE
jgi:hypothetical protein